MPFHNRKIRQVVLFYAIALGLCTAIALVATRIGSGALFVAMFTPATAVVICRVFSREEQRFRFSELGFTRLGLRYWPFAFIAPLLVILPGYLAVWTSGIGTIEFLPGDADALKFGAKLAVSILLGATLGALGEEVGWRGYMLPRLAEVFGEVRASLAVGFLHGVWHLPIILLTPYYHADAPAILVIPLFLIAITFSGPIFGYLRFASGSIIPVALMHEAWNAYWENLASRTAGEDRALIACVSGEAGIVTILMLALLAVWVCRSEKGLVGVGLLSRSIARV